MLISSRSLLSLTVGLFGIALGAIALARDPHSRLNRSFGLYAIITAVWWMPGTEFLERLFGHATALVCYRMTQAAAIGSSYFFLKFIQELSGVFDRPFSRTIRIALAAVILILLPLYSTGLFVRDFVTEIRGSDLAFIRQPGPLFHLTNMIHLVVYFFALGTAIRGYRSAQGLKRNQMKFILTGLGAGLLSLVTFGMAPWGVDVPWLYFSLIAVMMLFFAYAIFKYNLFDFGVWARRFSIYLGVYLPLISLPFLFLLPLRDWIFPTGEPNWTIAAVGTLTYAVLFSVAPFVTGYLRELAERQRWSQLQRQLQLVTDSAEALSDETGISLEEIANRIRDVVRELYWNRMKNPLQYLIVVLIDQNRRMAVSSHPPHELDGGILNEFFENLKKSPPSLLNNPFGSLDLRHRMGNDVSATDQYRLIDRYLEKNGIEVCCPCVHDRRLNGVILLGAKHSGIFWPEELSALHMTATHASTAVRKSELLITNEELRALDRLKSDLISNITHEFKNPTHIIENAVQVLLDEFEKESPDRERTRKYAMMIRNNNSQLNLFIRDLLDIAKIEEAKVELKRMRIDVAERLTRTIEAFRPLATHKGLRITTQIDGIRASVDPNKLDQIVCNLLSNAIKFTEQGTIDIRLEKAAGFVRLTIADTGAGIAPGYLSAIFEKFFQGPQSPLIKTDGAGLGLAIAKGWTEAHGGRIRAESEGTGKGSRFIVELPIEDPDWSNH